MHVFIMNIVRGKEVQISTRQYRACYQSAGGHAE